MSIYKYPGDITKRLHKWSTGSRDAENDLFEAVFPDLRCLAQYLIRRERDGYPLEPAELVNQIYFRLAAAKKQVWQNRQHFFAFAARAMRQHLIDCARAQGDKKFISIEANDDRIASVSADLELLILLNRLLDQLRATNRNWLQVVELKYFRGLTDREAAQVMSISLRTMQRMYADAQLWLSERARPEGVIRSRRRGATRRHGGVFAPASSR
jgi:RNA polymerase sigma factor (TIGR02999 family)